MSELHSKFLDRLEESDGPREYVAWGLKRRGFNVYLPPTRKAPTIDVREQFSDAGDIWVYGLDGVSEYVIVEVKEIFTATFWSPKDWIFGHGVFVDGVSTLEKKDKSRLYGYALVSHHKMPKRKLSGVIWIPYSSHPSWKVWEGWTKQRNEKKKRKSKTWKAPLSACVTSGEFMDGLRARLDSPPEGA